MNQEESTSGGPQGDQSGHNSIRLFGEDLQRVIAKHGGEVIAQQRVPLLVGSGSAGNLAEPAWRRGRLGKGVLQQVHLLRQIAELFAVPEVLLNAPSKEIIVSTDSSANLSNDANPVLRHNRITWGGSVASYNTAKVENSLNDIRGNAGRIM